MNLPDTFIQTIHNVYGAKGSAWLSALPSLVDEASRHWGLKNIQVVPTLSYNFVAFAEGDVVLKIGVPTHELTSEITALGLFNGNGAARLLGADAERGMFLLERARPGKMLSTLQNDEEATHIACDVMLKLWKPATSNSSLIRLPDWFKEFGKLRERFTGDRKLIERAETSVKEFLSEDQAPMLIHGDLHHFNILSSDRGWLAIDAKGVIGHAAYEVGPLLVNPGCDLEQIKKLTETRIAILSERLGFEKDRIREWAIAYALLSAWWGIEDNTGWEYAMGCARIFSTC